MLLGAMPSFLGTRLSAATVLPSITRQYGSGVHPSSLHRPGPVLRPLACAFYTIKMKNGDTFLQVPPPDIFSRETYIMRSYSLLLHNHHSLAYLIIACDQGVSQYACSSLKVLLAYFHRMVTSCIVYLYYLKYTAIGITDVY